MADYSWPVDFERVTAPIYACCTRLVVESSLHIMQWCHYGDISALSSCAVLLRH